MLQPKPIYNRSENLGTKNHSLGSHHVEVGVLRINNYD